MKRRSRPLKPARRRCDERSRRDLLPPGYGGPPAFPTRPVDLPPPCGAGGHVHCGVPRALGDRLAAQGAVGGRGAGAQPGGRSLAAAAAGSGLLVQLVPELPARTFRLPRRHADRHPVRLGNGDQPRVPRHHLPGIRDLAADPTAGVGASADHLLADAGALARLRNLPRRNLHHHAQRDRRRALDRSALLSGGALDGVEQLGHLPAHHPAWRAALDRGWLRGRHRHHLERGGGSGDDLGWRWRDPIERRRWPGVLHLELLHRLLLSAHRGRHDQHRHRRVHLERDHPQARLNGHPLAEDTMSEAASGEGSVLRAGITAGEIEVSHVSKGYGDARFHTEVVRDCSFTVERNKLTVMIGPSGCGKSTLIRLLAGFEKPSSGTIAINGQPVTGPRRDRLVLFQESALFPWMNTWDNILYGPRARGETTKQTLELAEFLLNKVGLAQFRRKYPTQLSGGMQRRAELARAMINNPAVMILDEPFRGLDAMTKVLMWEYYAALFEETRRTNFFVTTDIDEAIFLADRLLIMSNMPTRVRAVLEIDLPRPRTQLDLVENDRANEIKMQALSILHEEAMKSFSRGSKAAADFVDAYSKRVSRT